MRAREVCVRIFMEQWLARKTLRLVLILRRVCFRVPQIFGENQPLSAAGEMLRLTTLRIAKLECSRATPGIRDRCCLWMRS